MYLSRIRVVNFRNFSGLDVELAGNIVVVGENRVGKSNLLYALRLIFDPALADSARQLNRVDFWDGLEEPGSKDKIIVSVEIEDFEDNLDVLALLTDYRLDDDPETVRLTYEFRPRADLEGYPTCDEDYEFVCYGGEDEFEGIRARTAAADSAGAAACAAGCRRRSGCMAALAAAPPDREGVQRCRCEGVGSDR